MSAAANHATLSHPFHHLRQIIVRYPAVPQQRLGIYHRQSLPTDNCPPSFPTLSPSRPLVVPAMHRIVTNICTSSRGRNLVPVDSLINRWTHIQRPRVRARRQITGALSRINHQQTRRFHNSVNLQCFCRRRARM